MDEIALLTLKNYTKDSINKQGGEGIISLWKPE